MTEQITKSSIEEVQQPIIKLKRKGRYPKMEGEKIKCENTEKLPKERKPKKVNTREYNREYYHTSKTEATCICGMVLNKRCLNRHLGRRCHEENLKLTSALKSN